MPKIKPLLRWLQGFNPDPEAVERLYGLARQTTLTYSELASALGETNAGHLIVLDSSFFGRHEVDWAVWEALLKSTLVIPRYVWKELEVWREKPFANERIAGILSAAETRKNPRIILDHQQPWGKNYRYGRSYYNTLLAQRKRRAGGIVASFREQTDQPPTPNDLNHLFSKYGGERDFHLLRKGYYDRDKKNFFADEDVVVTAAMAGLESGRSSTIFTRDGDLLEQFYKLCRLLVTHYQAMLFAEWYAAQPGLFSVRPMPREAGRLEAYFDCENSFLVKKPVNNPARFSAVLLPLSYRPVYLSCFLFGGQPPNMTLTEYSFVAEQDMRRVFRVKGATMGLSTDRLGGKNCHVTGLPVGVDDSRNWVAIAEDKLLHFWNGPLRIPLLDLAHATNHSEMKTSLPRIPKVLT